MASNFLNKFKKPLKFLSQPSVLSTVATLLVGSILLGQGCGRFVSESLSSESRYLDDGFGNLIEYKPGPMQIRLLSESELSRTLSDLIGQTASDSLDYDDATNGYDTGTGSQVNESVQVLLMNEMERVSGLYVENRIRADFPCITSSTISSECLQQVIADFTLKAYRGFANATDHQELTSFYNSIAASTSQGEALQHLITRILLSPKFLYRIEVGLANQRGTSGGLMLSDLEKASLLSYSLTGSMPDGDLLKDAMAGQLSGDILKGHVRRLLSSDAGRARVTHFFRGWMRMGVLEDMVRTPQSYEKFASANVAAGLLSEFNAFVQSVVFDGDTRLDTLILSPHSFANQYTDYLYGRELSGTSMTKIDVNPQERRGILTLASVMAVHSAENEAFRDRPTERGLLIKNQFLCEEVGLPSGIDIDTATQAILDKYPDFYTYTIRQQFELLMEQGQSCSACHSQFMPFGFMFSNFNALGQFVMEQNEKPVNSVVTNLQAGRNIGSSYENIASFVPDLAKDPRVPECFTKNFVRYALGRFSGDDIESISKIMAGHMRKSSLSVTNMLYELFSSDLLYEKQME